MIREKFVNIKIFRIDMTTRYSDRLRLEREKNWVDFYNSLANIRDKSKEKDGFATMDVNDRDQFFNKLFERILRLGKKIDDSGDHSSIFMQGNDKNFIFGEQPCQILLTFRSGYVMLDNQTPLKNVKGMNKLLLEGFDDKDTTQENYILNNY